jgi:hypothetical protein
MDRFPCLESLEEWDLSARGIYIVMTPSAPCEIGIIHEEKNYRPRGVRNMVQGCSRDDPGPFRELSHSAPMNTRCR